jgi:hypothetical protein
MVPIKKVNPTRSPVFIAAAASIVCFSFCPYWGVCLNEDS